MSTATHKPETDLILPLPADGEEWDSHTIHTHYFGGCVPDASLGFFAYIRYQPAFPLSQGGLCVFSGLDNAELLDMDFSDYQITMPWPQIEGNTIETANGLRIEFLEPGKKARVTYTSPDGGTSLDCVQTAVSPLLVRGHVMPGEETDTDPSQTPGGSEQFMHCTGELVVRGERHELDCHAPRDRSWRQVRTEAQGGAAPVPPVCWTPMCFGDDLIFNQISFEPADTDPAWTGLFEIPADKPTHHFAWLYADGELREIASVRRNVLEYHPELNSATKQEVVATDGEGGTHTFRGEAIAAAAMPAWPNACFRDSVYRWESEDGRLAHGTCQEIWFDTYQRAMKARAAEGANA